MALPPPSQLPFSEQPYWSAGVAQTPLQTTSALWQDYLASHKAGNWPAALQVINQLLATTPQHAAYWRVKAKLHGALGHSASCLLAIDTLLGLVPGDLDGLRMKAMYLHCHHEHEHALDICTQVLAAHPRRSEFIHLKTSILKTMQDTAP